MEISYISAYFKTFSLERIYLNSRKLTLKYRKRCFDFFLAAPAESVDVLFELHRRLRNQFFSESNVARSAGCHH